MERRGFVPSKQEAKDTDDGQLPKRAVQLTNERATTLEVKAMRPVLMLKLPARPTLEEQDKV